MKQIKFMDGSTYRIGDRVEVSTKYGTRGFGRVVGIEGGRAPYAGVLGYPAKVKVEMDRGAEYGPLDRHPLKDGGFYDRLRDHGVSGGEICGHA